MKRLLVLLPLIAFVAGCIKPTDSGSSANSDSPSTTSYWVAQAASSKGQFVLAAPAQGKLSLSLDSGATLTALSSSPDLVWVAVAASASGQVLVAEGHAPGATALQLWVSTSYGLAWTNRTPAAGLTGAFTLTPDGNSLWVGSSTSVLKSTNAGVSWTAEKSLYSPLPLAAAGRSADGTVVMLLGGDTDRSVSVVGVSTWTPATVLTGWTTDAAFQWQSAVLDTTGKKRVLLGSNATSSTLYWSTDSGSTWNKVVLPILASRLVGNDDLSQLWLVPSSTISARPYRSLDAGATWTPVYDYPTLYWTYVTSDATGLTQTLGGQATAVPSVAGLRAYRLLGGAPAAQTGTTTTSTVTFQVDGTTFATASVVSPTVTVSPWPATPTKSGSFLKGWQRSDASAFTKYSIVTADVTVTAIWSSQPVVSFDTQGGSPVDPVSVNPGDKVTKPTDPVRGGYNFLGWYKDAAGTTAWDFANDTVSANVTLTAVWAPTQGVSVTLDFPQGSTTVVTAGGSVATGNPFTATVTGTYSAMQWYLDGTALAGQTSVSVTVATGSLVSGIHELMFIGTSGTTTYNGRVTFQVTQ